MDLHFVRFQDFQRSFFVSLGIFRSSFLDQNFFFSLIFSIYLLSKTLNGVCVAGIFYVLVKDF